MPPPYCYPKLEQLLELTGRFRSSWIPGRELESSLAFGVIAGAR